MRIVISMAALALSLAACSETAPEAALSSATAEHGETANDYTFAWEGGGSVTIEMSTDPAFAAGEGETVGTFEGVVESVDPAAQPNGQFRVLIAEDPDAEIPWPEERYVRYGAGARAWILLETVPLGYELWRQMNSFPPTLPATAEGTP